MEMYEFDQLSDEAQARAVATVRHALYAEGFDPTEELTMQAARDAYYTESGMYVCTKAVWNKQKKSIERQLKSTNNNYMCLF